MQRIYFKSVFKIICFPPFLKKYKLFFRNLSARYNACVKLASSHALIQFGVSIWKRDSLFREKVSKNPNISPFYVSSYNFYVLSTDIFKGLGKVFFFFFVFSIL